MRENNHFSLMNTLAVRWSALHLFEKNGENFPLNGTVRMEKTVVSLWNQMEGFFPLVILGKNPRISTRSIVREPVTEANGSVIFGSFRNGKNGKRGLRLKLFLFFQKIPSGRTLPFVVPPERPVFLYKWKALVVSVEFPRCFRI